MEWGLETLACLRLKTLKGLLASVSSAKDTGAAQVKLRDNE